METKDNNPFLGKKLIPVCPTGHEDWYKELMNTQEKPEMPNEVREVLSLVPGIPSLKEIIEPKLVTLSDLLDISEEILGRFLGLCTAERGDTSPGHLREAERTFNGIMNGIKVKLTVRSLTRFITIEIERAGLTTVRLEKDWRYPGDYETQKESMNAVLSELFYEVWFSKHITIEKLSPILAKRDHAAMKELLPPFVDYRFKGNKGVYFMLNGKEFHYKDLSVHGYRDKLIMYAAFYHAVVESMVALKHPITDKVDFSNKPDWHPRSYSTK